MTLGSASDMGHELSLYELLAATLLLRVVVVVVFECGPGFLIFFLLIPLSNHGCDFRLHSLININLNASVQGSCQVFHRHHYFAPWCGRAVFRGKLICCT